MFKGSSDLVFLVRGPPGPSASKGVLESSLEDVWKILERIWLLAARAGAALSAVQADQGNLDKYNLRFLRCLRCLNYFNNFDGKKYSLIMAV